MKPFLKIDNQIALHLPHPKLANEIFQAVDNQRAYLRQWLPWVDANKTAHDTLLFIEDAIKQNQKGSKLTTFIYNGNQFAGSLGFVKLEKDKRLGEIGYWLHESMQGQGIMTKSCQRFIDYAFRTKALNRIEIKVASGNNKSQSVPQRLGFTHEGTLREELLMYGEFLDIEIFSFLKREWLEMKKG